MQGSGARVVASVLVHSLVYQHLGKEKKEYKKGVGGGLKKFEKRVICFKTTGQGCGR